MSFEDKAKSEPDELFRRSADNAAAVEPDVSGRWVDEPGDAAEQCRLSGTVRTEDEDDFAGSDSEIDPP